MTPKTQSDLVDRHQDYRAKGDEPRHIASQQFFERLGLISLLGEAELHSLITAATRNLMSVHNAFNNFHNEPPFADRLAGLASQNRVPETAQHDFVEVVVTAATGNQYGTSNAALGAYYKMIRSFSPGEIRIMLELPNSRSLAGNRIRVYANCASRFKELVALLDPSSVPTQSKGEYQRWA